MKHFYLHRCFLVFACATAMVSCNKELSSNSPQQVMSSQEEIASFNGQAKGTAAFKRDYGPSRKMGKGEVRSFITVSEAGMPQELGIEMTKDALTRLPGDPDKGTFKLTLPAEAKKLTSFNHVVIEWNIHGHPPFFYQLPHFDFHFYTQPEKEVDRIPTYAANPSGFNHNPAGGFLPPTYIAPPGGEEAAMGKHWVDATAPELPWNGGATFTKTFIYGSYDGKVNFLEPMITLAYLQNCVSSTTAFPQPALFAQHTNYPEKYNIYKGSDGKALTYNVSLSSFVKR